jgi:hypothetical protein
MTKNFEDTILSLLRGIDKRIDNMSADIAELKTDYVRLNNKVDLVIDILAEHSAKLKENDKRHDKHDANFKKQDAHFRKHDAYFGKHDALFKQVIAGVIPEMEKSTRHGIKLKNHERRITTLESA